MTFQRIQKTALTNTETPTTSQLRSRPFAPITQQTTPTPTPHRVLQRNTNLLAIPGLMAIPKKVIQAKLTIGEPGDKYEQEADTVARQVVQRLNAPLSEQTLDISQFPSAIQHMKHKTLQRSRGHQSQMETHVKTGQSSYGVIQRDAAADAAAHTAAIEIRRGNRRGSIDETNYKSAVNTQFISDNRHRAQMRLQLEKMLLRDKQTAFYQLFGSQVKKAMRDRTTFTTILTEFFQAGNCDHFAASTYTYLMQHTNQENIYIARMTGGHNGVTFKHAFTIKSPQDVTEATELNPQTAVVIDAWSNYKVQTLAQFFYGENPYGVTIDASNIRIDKKGLSTGEGLADEVIEYIRDAALSVHQKYIDEYRNELQYLRDGRKEVDPEHVFEFDRTGRDVDDMRTQM